MILLKWHKIIVTVNYEKKIFLFEILFLLITNTLII